MKKSAARIAAILITFVLLIGSSIGIISASASPHYEQYVVENVNTALENFEKTVGDGNIYLNLSGAYEKYVELSRLLDRYYYGNEADIRTLIDNAISDLNGATNALVKFEPYTGDASAALDGSYTKNDLFSGNNDNGAGEYIEDEMTNVLVTVGVGDSTPYQAQTTTSTVIFTYNDERTGVQYGAMVFLYDGKNTMAAPINLFFKNARGSGTYRVRFMVTDTAGVELRHRWHGETTGTKYQNYAGDTGIGYVYGDKDHASSNKTANNYQSNTLYYTADTFNGNEGYSNKIESVHWIFWDNKDSGNYEQSFYMDNSGSMNNTAYGYPYIYAINYKALLDKIDSAKSYLSNISSYSEGGLKDFIAALDNATKYNPNDDFAGININNVASDLEGAVNTAAANIKAGVDAFNVTVTANGYDELRAAIDAARGLYFENSASALGVGGENPIKEDGNVKYCPEPWKAFAEAYSAVADRQQGAFAAMQAAGAGGNYTDAAGAKNLADALNTARGNVTPHEPGSEIEIRVPEDGIHKKAKCEEDGLGVEYSSCPNCQSEYIHDDAYVIEKGHTLVHDRGGEANCTEPGIDPHWQCVRDADDLYEAGCGKYFEYIGGGQVGEELVDGPQYVDPFGHKFTLIQEAQEATCLHSSQAAVWKCSECGLDFLDDNPLSENYASDRDFGEKDDKESHTFEHHGQIEATCLHEGNSDYWSCPKCGTMFHSENENDVWGADEESPILPRLDHEFEKDGAETPYKPPTCYDDGNILYYTCDNCGEKFATDSDSSVAPLTDEQIAITATGDHSLVEHGSKPATCVDEGYYAYYECQWCGARFIDADGSEATEDELIEPINKSNHVGVWQAHTAIDSTCTEYGWERDNIQCLACGLYFSDYEHTNESEALEEEDIRVDLKNHDEEIVTEEQLTSSTCTVKGTKSVIYTCSMCRQEQRRELKELDDYAPHTPKYVKAEDPTCMADGVKAHYMCSVCGQYFNAADTECAGDPLNEEEIADLVIGSVGHDFSVEGDVKVEATCNTNAVYEYSCSYGCGTATQLEKENTMTGHNMTEHAKTDPKCLTGGVPETYYSCDKCHLNYKDDGKYTTDIYSGALSVLATGHSWGEWETVVSTDCENGGSEKRTCPKCGTVETNNLDPTGHDWEKVLTIDKEPTCTEDGSKSRHCKNCDAQMDSETIPALEHDWVIDEAVPPTATEPGFTEGKHCSRGDAKVEQEVIPATGELELVILAGENQTYVIDSHEDKTIVCYGNCDMFVELRLNGETVGRDLYTLKEGSTIVTFKAEFLNTLAPGRYDVKLVYTYDSITANLTVAENKTEENTETPSNGSGINTSATSPGTGLAITIPVFSLAAFAGGFFSLGYAGKKKNEEE